MLDLEKIKARAELATPGPRHSMYGGEPNLVSGQRGEKVDLLAEFHGPSHDGRCPDADFFAYAREDILELIAEVERLQMDFSEVCRSADRLIAEVKQLRAMNKEMRDTIEFYAGTAQLPDSMKSDVLGDTGERQELPCITKAN